MALVIDDRVKETSTTTGTGTYDLAGAATGFQTFVAGVGTGNTTWYAATDGTNWEVGIGTVTDATPDTLARTTVISSSNADAAVNWAAGTRTLTCTLPASKAFIGPTSAVDNAVVRYDGTGGRTVQNSSTVTVTDSAQIQFQDNGYSIIGYGSAAGIDIRFGNGAVASGGFLDFYKTRNASAFSHTVVASGDDIGVINFRGSDGDQFHPAASIKGMVDATASDNDMPGKLAFYTTADAASSLTERLRITSSGGLISSTGQVVGVRVFWTANSTTMLESFNMDSIADTATGDADGTISTDFNSATWTALIATQDTTNGWDAEEVQGSGFNAKAAGTFGVLCSTITDGGTAAASLTDPDQWNVVGFGVLV
jgi:hypothetical protein